MEKVEKSSSAGTENDSSTNVQDSQVCQPIAKSPCNLKKLLRQLRK